MSKPGAIGYVRRDVSGVQQQWDEERIRRLARRLGYCLQKTVAFSAHTDAPVQQLVEFVERTGVDAVIIPSLDHFSGTVPCELVAVADVVCVFPDAETFARQAGGRVPDRLDDSRGRAENRPRSTGLVIRPPESPPADPAGRARRRGRRRP